MCRLSLVLFLRDRKHSEDLSLGLNAARMDNIQGYVKGPEMGQT